MYTCELFAKFGTNPPFKEVTVKVATYVWEK